MSIILTVIYGLTVLFSLLLVLGVFGSPIPTLLGKTDDMEKTTFIFSLGVMTMVPTLLMYYATSNFKMKKVVKVVLFVVGIVGVVGLGVFYTM